ncbi:tRNA (adenine(22)-N(1))-methyltransferase [Lihuaxuella thermophila]|uniref:tRNA (Adenine22-N1)-methyltransferase n=1 Tax=Lihuaxuella thermophila TaxID=1173111 RepID=A0A1H8DD29_9BACL|nr:class I SAM-dependent methyltransferase [Lihuaxuella thermophila]SEN05192.1 tRNA (adenine22-N1)-methyltransferase [Lihuaxuella thermophila]
MNHQETWQISQRLQTIAGYIPDHMRVADIGGDHAFLLLHVAKQGRLHKGIVGEVNRGPYENARDRVKQMGFSSLIDVRLGNGLSVIKPNEVDVVVIAGMGGSLITRILDEGRDRLESVKRLVLQPNIGASRVREWLMNHRFQIIDETIVEDAEILYEIIVAEPGNGDSAYRDGTLDIKMLLQIGPVLWQKKHPLLKKKLLEEWKGKQKILKQLERAVSEEARSRKLEVEKEIKEWEKVMACL